MAARLPLACGGTTKLDLPLLLLQQSLHCAIPCCWVHALHSKCTICKVAHKNGFTKKGRVWLQRRVSSHTAAGVCPSQAKGNEQRGYASSRAQGKERESWGAAPPATVTVFVGGRPGPTGGGDRVIMAGTQQQRWVLSGRPGAL